MHSMFCIITIMNARSIVELFKRACFEHVKTPLGRWNIHNHRQTTLKIKYANEDNCGISCNYNKNTTQMQNQDSDNLYIYMMGCETVPDNAYITR
jgi:hypothetical protein